MSTLLSASGVAVMRGDNVLFSGLGFDLRAGEVLQLEGANGSGKTTLLKALCLLTPVDDGEFYWRGEKLPGARDSYFEQMRYLSHNDALNGNLTAGENLAFAACMASTDRQLTGKNKLTAVLERVGLAKRFDVPTKSLSAGQRRRVGLARLLVSQASLWLMDEPLTALDTQGRALVETLIAEQVNAGGSVIFTTHQALPVAACDVRSIEIH